MRPEKHIMRRTIAAAAAALFLALIHATVALALPASYDLRNVGGTSYVTPVKSQQGGTCWCHGTMAAVESNLLVTGNWTAAGLSGVPNLGEYHLDWWNGFNTYNNDDAPGGTGVAVHNGGDYLVGTAYMSRGEGVYQDHPSEGNWYANVPPRQPSDRAEFYVRQAEWYVAGTDLGNIDTIKQALVDHGALATCMYYAGGFYSSGTDSHYQPPTDSHDPNHSIAIVGWNDTKVTQAPQAGAWLCKNSWGSSWSGDGYFWISYYDKHAAQHPEMGAVSFQGAVLNPYQTIYYHDYHGWRDTMTGTTNAFNAFTAGANETLSAVSFFTAADGVAYTVTVYDSFQGGQLLGVLASEGGTLDHIGLHTIDLSAPVALLAGDDFYIHVALSEGGQPFDRTSQVEVLLDPSVSGQGAATVVSAAAPGESYYLSGGVWYDLFDYDFGDPAWNGTANFTIKGLAVESQGGVFVPEPGSPGALVIVLLTLRTRRRR